MTPRLRSTLCSIFFFSAAPDMVALFISVRLISSSSTRMLAFFLADLVAETRNSSGCEVSDSIFAVTFFRGCISERRQLQPRRNSRVTPRMVSAYRSSLCLGSSLFHSNLSARPAVLPARDVTRQGAALMSARPAASHCPLVRNVAPLLTLGDAFLLNSTVTSPSLAM